MKDIPNVPWHDLFQFFPPLMNKSCCVANLQWIQVKSSLLSKYLATFISITFAKLIQSLMQIQSMRVGLLKVVPQAVLDLLPWQELEKKVCGDPEITVEALKRLSE